MDNAIWGMLNETEKELLRLVEPEALDELDEDGLAELHNRIRRARNKYSKLYRRRAAEEVDASGARAKGHARHHRTLVKAEAFEEALAEVSARLAKAARASASALKKERLTRAGTAKAAPGTKAKGGAKAKGKGKTKAVKVSNAGKKAAPRSSAKTPVSKKSVASQRATKARKQAKRAAR